MSREDARYEHVRRNTGDLIPYTRNSRLHSEAQVAQIAGAIRTFGFTNPVLIDERDNIIAGHGRVMAAHKLKLADLPCIVVSGLSENERRALVIADNRLAEKASWDTDMLCMELGDIQSDGEVPLEVIGYDQNELDALLNGWNPDMSKIDKVSAELAELMAILKIKCPQESADRVADVVRTALTEAGITDATVA